MNNATSAYDIFILQAVVVVFGLHDIPAVPMFVLNFPILKRFTTFSFSYALSRAVVYIITSFGLVYLTNAFGHYGLWFVTIPISLMFLWGLNHFEELNKQFETTTNAKEATEEQIALQ